MKTSKALIILAKAPIPRLTKTRLSPPLTLEQANDLYACFLQDVLDLARHIRVPSTIAYTPEQAKTFFGNVAPDFELVPQTGRDLGERMHLAVANKFFQGCRQVVLIGSDSPHLPPLVIQQAFDELSRGADIVLGPSADGGYYLIGLREPCPQIFQVKMSTPEVLNQTLVLIQQAGLKFSLLPENFDVDTIADLGKLWITLNRHPDIPARHTRTWLKMNQQLMQQHFSI